MRISGRGQETFLYLNGLGVCEPLRLDDNIELLPAHCTPDPDDMIRVAKSEIDIGVITIFLRQVRSQLRVTAEDPEALAARAWNSLWDVMLLGAMHGCEVMCNFQCDKPAEYFNGESQLEITNYHLRGLTETIYEPSEEDVAWIAANFEKARALVDKPVFQLVVQSLVSYRWHTHPRASLALLWSAIEGLFGVESELAFRLSLYAARFLAPGDEDEMNAIFAKVKKLYKQRCFAVHGAKMKRNASEAVDATAQLLKALCRQCIATGDLPHVKDLAP